MKNKTNITSLNDLRRSTTELLALAVRRLFPNAELAGGDTTSLGFFYDFATDQPIDEQMLPVLEQEMFSIIKSDPEIRSLNMMKQNAVDFLKHHDQPIRSEQVALIPENIVELIQIGDFYDLCPIPHLESLTEPLAFKLLYLEKVVITLPESGEIPVLRIHGTAFDNPKTLKKFLKRAESAKKKDHRQLVKDLDLASTHELTAKGCWFWHPKGMALRETLIDWWRQQYRAQHYQLVSTPKLLKPDLLNKGNITKYLREMAALPPLSIEGVKTYLPSQNASAHALLFARKQHSYRELPIRYAEFSDYFDPIKESQLWGLLQTRTYYGDEAHVFCSIGQVEDELISSLQFIDKTIRMFGFEYQWHISPKGPRHAGTVESWNKGIQWLTKAAQKSGLSIISEDQESESGGTFKKDEKSIFGPRAIVTISDALGRLWEGPSVGIDLNMPESFGLRYQGPDDAMHAPIVINRSTFGSLERFVALLIELDGGEFPLWLAPEQVRVIPVRSENLDYAKTVLSQCEQHGFRASVDDRSTAMGEKVYIAERDKIPYLLIVGDKEQNKGEVNMRRCQHNDKGSSIRLDQLLAQLRQEVDSKKTPK